MYAVLSEICNDDAENCFYFIKYEGNEAALRNLRDSLGEINWEKFENMYIFRLDMDNLVSDTTAREMSNTIFYNKVFNSMKMIDFNFEENDSNESNFETVIEKIGFGNIRDYLEDEDDIEDDSDEEILFKSPNIDRIPKSYK